jgi:hypothetical protein
MVKKLTGEKRKPTDYEQPKAGFVEVEQLTQHDYPIGLSGVDADQGKVELPLARRYKIEMVEPKHGVAYQMAAPRKAGDLTSLPEDIIFKVGVPYYTPLDLPPEDAWAFAMKCARIRVRLNVPIFGSKYKEQRASTILVHRFKVTCEERLG